MNNKSPLVTTLITTRDEVVRQMEEEKQLVTAMKKEEDKQLRLERIRLLKEILKKKKWQHQN